MPCAAGPGGRRRPLQDAENHAGQLSYLVSPRSRRCGTSSADIDTLADLDMNQKREDAVTLSGIPMAKATWDWESRLGHHVKLRDLHILTAVVRWKGMARAAAHLAMSNAAVSGVHDELERALCIR